MPPAPILLICAVVAIGYYAGKPVVHAVKKADQKICHIVTLGKKCKK